MAAVQLQESTGVTLFTVSVDAVLVIEPRESVRPRIVAGTPVTRLLEGQSREGGAGNIDPSFSAIDRSRPGSDGAYIKT